MEYHYYYQGHLLSFYEQLHIYTPTLVCVQFLGQTEPQTSSKYLVIADLQTIFHTQFEGLLTTYLHTKFHIPTHN
jgi:phosphate starvation-inducible membrane PsiE